MISSQQKKNFTPFFRSLRCKIIVCFLTSSLSGVLFPASYAQEASPSPETIDLSLDQSQVFQLPDKTATVVVGNPSIASAALLKKTSKVILTGHGFGTTNLIALDSTGNLLGESLIRIRPRNDHLTVQRGLSRYSYTCLPKCEPVMRLGDDTTYTADLTSQIQQRNQLAQPNGPTR